MPASLPPGPKLYAANRRLAAARHNWPPGALEACERLDAVHGPRWSTSWRHPWRDEPAGFYASHDDHTHLERELYAATPEALDEAIRAHVDCPVEGWRVRWALGL